MQSLPDIGDLPPDSVQGAVMDAVTAQDGTIPGPPRSSARPRHLTPATTLPGTRGQARHNRFPRPLWPSAHLRLPAAPNPSQASRLCLFHVKRQRPGRSPGVPQ